MTEIVVVRPDRAVAPLATTPPAPRFMPARGDRVVLVDNGKPNAAALLAAFARQVALRLDLAPDDVEIERKPTAAQPIAADRAEALAGRVRLAITGLGDCGGCSACSVHDAVIFERLGVPAVPVITEPFQGLAATVAERLGMPGLGAVVVPHPVSTKPESWLEHLASVHADEMVALLAAQGHA